MDAAANPLIFLSAGEASGEQYGVALMEAVRRLLPGAFLQQTLVFGEM